MRVPGQFNAPVARVEGAPSWFAPFLERYATTMKRLAERLPGPTVSAMGAVATAATVKLPLGDLVTLTLAGNATLTLDQTTRAGAEGLLELTQDGRGGRVPTWVGARWTNGVAPTIALGPNARTLIGFTYTAAGWVGRVLASNY